MSSVMLSVDPGKDSAWVLWRSGEIDSYGLLDGDDIFSILRLMIGVSPIPPNIPKIMRGIEIPCDATLVIEDQWLGVNYRNSKVITERRMRWQSIAQLLGWKIELVQPTSWQSKIINGTPNCAKTKQVKNKKTGQTVLKRVFDTKKAAMIVASSITKKNITSHDLADAICIGQYWVNRISQQLPLELPKQPKPKRRTKNVRGKKD